MDPDFRPRADRVFDRALDLPRADRSTFLDEACRDDPALRAAVEDLLARADRATTGDPPDPAPPPGVGAVPAGTDSHPAAGRDAPPHPGPPPDVSTPQHVAPDEPAGTAVAAGLVVAGRYRLLKPLGEGGMGAVWLAEQLEPVRREVALKLIRDDLDGRQVLARFEAERQALAMMDHPNIAKVLDAGVAPDGRPFFVMELVKGVPITTFCDDRKLAPRDRLGLFLQVCAAVRHAHQKGVIHRDLKPGNVLAAVYDAAPVAKVIDFGVAKAVGPPLTDPPVRTWFAQPVGTWLYMAPEQAGRSGRDADTRADVYALGGLLYELLTGAPPFKDRFREVGYDELEMRRILREEEPPRPSARLSAPGPAAAARGTEPRKLSARVRGDLDWIVLKALEKDPDRRYESAAALAADVGRYLAGEPVLAHPPGVAYRLGKFVRRNRGWVAAAVLVLAAAAGAAYAGVENRLKRQAEDARDRVAAARERLARVEYGRAAEVAHTECLAGNVAGAREVLAGTRAEFRGWEYQYVHRLCHADLLTLGEHQGRVHSVAFSREGDRVRVLTGGGDGARVWDPETGNEVLRLSHPGTVRAAFSRDGRRVLTVGVTEARLWDGATGRVVAALGHPGGVASGAFSPDGARVLTVGKGPADRLRVWDAGTGGGVAALRHDPAYVEVAAFSPDGSRVVAGVGGTARVWDVETGAELYALDHEGTVRSVGFWGRLAGALRGQGADPRGTVWTVAFSPDGRRVLTAGLGGALVWDARPGAEAVAFGPPGDVGAAAFSPDGSRLLTRTGTDRVWVWDVRTGAAVAAFRHAPAPAVRAAFSPDGTAVLTAGGTEVRVWDATTGDRRVTLRLPETVREAVFSPDGKTVATAGETAARVWDARAPAEGLDLGTSDVLAAVFSPDGKTVVTAGRDAAEAWDARTGERLVGFDRRGSGRPVGFCADGSKVVVPSDDGCWVCDARTGARRLAVTKTYTHAAALSPDGARVATVEWGAVRVRDARTGAELLALPHAITPLAVAFSPAGDRLLTVEERRVQVWDAGTGAELVAFKGPDVTWSAEWSPDGSRVVTAGDAGGRVWDAATGAEVLVLRHPGARAAAFSPPDGKRVVTAGAGGAARVWDAGSGVEVLALRHPGDVRAVAFSPPDGARVVTAGAGGARVWDATPLNRTSARPPAK